MALPKIIQMIKNRVSFAEAQTLTDAQKLQARTNIGSADDSSVVKLAGNQTIAGQKTFSSPILFSTDIPENLFAYTSPNGNKFVLQQGNESGDTGKETKAFGWLDSTPERNPEGAYILMRSKNFSPNEDKGEIQLFAHDGTDRSNLLLKADGTFQHDGRDIAVVDSYSPLAATGNGYIRYTNGLQIVWGYTSITVSGYGPHQWRISYPVPFITSWSVTTSFIAGWIYDLHGGEENSYTTGCDGFITYSNHSGKVEVYCVAVGLWK